MVVRQNLKMVRCRWYSGISTENVRIGGKTSWGVTVRAAVDL